MEFINRTMNQYFIEKHTSIIDQVTGWKIVTPINDDRIIIENFLYVFGRQTGIMSLNADMGVLPSKALRHHFDFGSAQVIVTK